MIVGEMVAGNEVSGNLDGGAPESGLAVRGDSPVGGSDSSPIPPDVLDEAPPDGATFGTVAAAPFGEPPACADATPGRAIALAVAIASTPASATIIGFAIGPPPVATALFIEAPLPRAIGAMA